MRARNKHTGEICEVFWDMCDLGRKCQASDKPTEIAPCIIYNAVVDDYDFDPDMDDNWIDGLEYLKRRGFKI